MTTNTFEEHLTKGIEAHCAGRIEEALTAYRAAIELQPDDAEAVSLMGLALSQSAWADQALGFLRHAVQLEPEQLPFRMNLVEGLERLGYVEQARAEVRAVIVRDAGHFRAWEKSGDLALRAGDLEAAAAAWTQARVLDPSAPGPALKLAQLALQRGEPAKSLAILDKLAERLPSDAQLLALRAESLAAARRWSDHAACVEQWLRAHPQDPEAYRALARQHFEAGQFREAANAYGRVLALRPPTAADWTSFASLALHALDLPAASAALEQAERLEPQNPQMIATRALLELYAGRFKAAEEDAERCLALDPDNSAAAVVLSRVRRGRLTEREAANLERIAA
ncbi:MAG: tetratricopeptide repeat protein, partial [Steroidobacteraceae bacterium]|nr:tetratricopeptide repeat protein [Steroidobacteraceae bacterium]MDW8258064.1 tetratricopeptide repeat protein [Gammaproteobacteria bacterium]